MPLALRNITFDCSDPYRLVKFWSEVTGWGEDPDNPNEPDDPEGLLVAPDGSLNLLFVTVPEGKQVKNRLHLCYWPTDTTRDVEVDRLLALGGSIQEDRRQSDGTGWAVMTDPEGNEFCVLRSAAERNDA